MEKAMRTMVPSNGGWPAALPRVLSSSLSALHSVPLPALASWCASLEPGTQG